MIIHNIGIVGQGFVGSAVKTSLSKYYSVHTFDTNKEKSCCDSLNDGKNKLVVLLSKILIKKNRGRKGFDR